MDELAIAKKTDRHVIILLGRYKGKYHYQSELNNRPDSKDKQRIIFTNKK